MTKLVKIILFFMTIQTGESGLGFSDSLFEECYARAIKAYPELKGVTFENARIRAVREYHNAY